MVEKENREQCKTTKKTMYPFVELWEMQGASQILSFECFVSIIVKLMTSEQRSLKSMKSNVSLQLVVIYIFLLSLLHKLSSLCVFVSNTSRGEREVWKFK